MPTILILFGLKFRIYVRDHEPVHVHVLSQDGEAKFQVGDEIRLMVNKGMKPKDIKLAESIIEPQIRNRPHKMTQRSKR